MADPSRPTRLPDGLRHGRTKLVCTIGPASGARVDELVAAGMDVARINFSHGNANERASMAAAVRAASDSAARPVALLTDLPGPKIRLGDVVGDEVRLEPGVSFTLHTRDAVAGDTSGAGVTYPRLGADVRRGDRILLADGAVELRVLDTEAEVRTEVVRGGLIRSRAGVSIPSDRLSEPALTPADRALVPAALGLGADYVAQSFVRRASDVRELRALLGNEGPPVVAKIETRAAVDDFDAVCGAADAVMIARGDLGVELAYEEVPILQKQLVRRALDRGVPTIVATQMLESMTSSPRPTRAEASDVANAIFDGADAIMLSGETAIGDHPVLAAEAAMRIARLCEQRGSDHLAPGGMPSTDTDADALAYAAVTLAQTDVGVAAIACYTRSGRSAGIISALRPRVPILAFSPEAAVLRRLALVHGVEPHGCPAAQGEARLEILADLVRRSGAVAAGSAIVLVASTAEPGSGPNLLEIHRV